MTSHAKRSENLLLLGIAAMVVLRLVLFKINTAMSWDEATYMSLARHLHRGGSYYNPYALVDSLRPPLLPSTITFTYIFFGENENVARLVSPVFGILSIAAVYFLAKTMRLHRTEGLLAALLVAVNPIHLFFSERVLTDMIFTALMTLTITFLYLSIRKSERFLLLTSFFIGLCFLTRYTGAVLLLILLLFLLITRRGALIKSKYLVISMIIFLTTLIPWFVIGVNYFNNPLGGLSYGAAVGIGSSEWWQNGHRVIYYFPSLLLLAFAMAPLTAIGIYYGLKRRTPEDWLLFLWILAIFLFYCITRPEVPIRDEVRFLLPTLPAMALFAAYAYSHLRKSANKAATYTALILIIICVSANLAGGYWLVTGYSNYEKHTSLMEACLYVKENSPTNITVMATCWPYVNYYADRACVGFPSETNLLATINSYNVSYILVNKYYPEPEYVHNYLINASLFVKEYEIIEAGEQTVAVYRVKA